MPRCPIPIKKRLSRPKQWLARALSRTASRIAPELDRKRPLPIEELLKLSGSVRIDPRALGEGKLEVRYRAIDALWRDGEDEQDGMIPLRDHMMRLCSVAEELSNKERGEGFYAIAENLHLGASLRDLAANTDVYGDSSMCSTAAAFDDAHSEVAAMYLAGVVVFNLAWAAYEGAVEIASRRAGMKYGKGARGRDLIFNVQHDKRFPYLRIAVLGALDLGHYAPADFRKPDMKRMLMAGSLAGIAAEHLREFRNALVHGKLKKPKPEDWGEKSRYVAKDDPAIRQFHANTRLTLLLIQILMQAVSRQCDELTAWFSDPQPAPLVLTQLHCAAPSDDADGLTLANAPLVAWEYH